MGSSSSDRPCSGMERTATSRSTCAGNEFYEAVEYCKQTCSFKWQGHGHASTLLKGDQNSIRASHGRH